MKRSLFSSLTAIVFFSLAGTALAGQVEVTLTGVNGVSRDGIEVSPYYATINDGTTRVSLYCDDFTHDIRLGEAWMANVNTFGDLSHVRFQGATANATLQHYGQAAWLIRQEASHPSSLADIQFALWGIFDPALMSGRDFTSASATWLTNAQGRVYTAGEFSNFRIYTPVDSGPGSAQELFGGAPEPGSLLLMGSGLIGLGCALRRRLVQS